MSLSPARRPADRRGSGGAGSPPRQPEFVNEFIMSLSPAGEAGAKTYCYNNNINNRGLYPLLLSLFELPPDASGIARPGPTRLTPTDPLRPPWSLRVARRVARIAPSRSESLDRAAPNDKSRPKKAPETLRDAIFDDFWSIFGSIFEVF